MEGSLPSLVVDGLGHFRHYIPTPKDEEFLEI